MADTNSAKTGSSNETDLRVPPHDINAEAAVLSAMMDDDWAASRAFEILSEEHFYKKTHRLIFRALDILYNKNIEIDLITIIDELKKSGNLEIIGGTPYLSEISDIVSSSANVEAHAKIVLEQATLRSLITTSNNIISDCYNSQSASKDIIERAEKAIFEVTQDLRHEGFERVSHYVSQTIGNIEKIAAQKSRVIGIASGFESLDNKIGGFQPGQFIVIAGRPSMGKTALAINMGFYTAMHQRKNVGIFSLEMDKEKLLMRMLSAGAEVSLSEMLQGYGMNQTKLFRITTVGDQLAEAAIFIDDEGSNTIADMRSKARRLKSEEGLDLLIIDYMQLMIPVASRQSRTQEITEISRGIKLLAKELEIPIIALSQLSRAPEKRPSNEPKLSDLRESGAIEQDADIVLLLYRDEYYTKEESKEPGVARVEIAKNRNGPQGRLKFEFVGEYTQFKPLREFE
ncbi:MAG: replicative DNA helicase [Candidatus Cloacimonadota bacterium]|nr:replicative DNA helicase [Candidatus Cloacimonadota bacterium]